MENFDLKQCVEACSQIERASIVDLKSVIVSICYFFYWVLIYPIAVVVQFVFLSIIYLICSAPSLVVAICHFPNWLAHFLIKVAFLSVALLDVLFFLVEIFIIYSAPSLVVAVFGFPNWLAHFLIKVVFLSVVPLGMLFFLVEIFKIIYKIVELKEEIRSLDEQMQLNTMPRIEDLEMQQRRTQRQIERVNDIFFNHCRNVTGIAYRRIIGRVTNYYLE